VRLLLIVSWHSGPHVVLVASRHRDLGRSTRTCRDLRAPDLTIRQVVLAVRRVFLQADLELVSPRHGDLLHSEVSVEYGAVVFRSEQGQKDERDSCARRHFKHVRY